MLLAEIPLRGEAYALGAALSWSLALVLFRKSGETMPPLALNLFKNVIALLLLLVTIPLAGESLWPAELLNNYRLGTLAVSALVGIVFSDTLLFYCLNLIGVARSAIVECLYSPLVALFSWLILAEVLTGLDAFGAVLIVGSVLLTARFNRASDIPRGHLILGLALGAIAMTSLAWAIVIATPVIEELPVFWTTAFRLLIANVVLGGYGLFSKHRKVILAAFRPNAAWRAAVPASVLGSYLSMAFWIGGFKYAEPAVAAMLNQTATVFSVVLAVVILREPMTRRGAWAVVMALVGVLIVTGRTLLVRLIA